MGNYLSILSFAATGPEFDATKRCCQTDLVELETGETDRGVWEGWIYIMKGSTEMEKGKNPL